MDEKVFCMAHLRLGKGIRKLDARSGLPWFTLTAMIFLFAFASTGYPTVRAAPLQGSSTILGQVIDAVTRHPIVDATIVASRVTTVGAGKTSQVSTSQRKCRDIG